MPARDIYHDAVKNALIKEGWTIVADPYKIRYEDAELFADLAAEKPIAAERKGHKIVVEVKSFVSPSPMRDFQQAPLSIHFIPKLHFFNRTRLSTLFSNKRKYV